MYEKCTCQQFLMSSGQNVSINVDRKPRLISCDSFPPISDFTSFDRTFDWLVFCNITIKYNISCNVHPFQSAAGMILRILKVAFTAAAVNFFQILTIDSSLINRLSFARCIAFVRTPSQRNTRLLRLERRAKAFSFELLSAFE